MQTSWRSGALSQPLELGQQPSELPSQQLLAEPLGDPDVRSSPARPLARPHAPFVSLLIMLLLLWFPHDHQVRFIGVDMTVESMKFATKVVDMLPGKSLKQRRVCAPSVGKGQSAAVFFTMFRARQRQMVRARLGRRLASETFQQAMLPGTFR